MLLPGMMDSTSQLAAAMTPYGLAHLLPWFTALHLDAGHRILSSYVMRAFDLGPGVVRAWPLIVCRLHPLPGKCDAGDIP